MAASTIVASISAVKTAPAQKSYTGMARVSLNKAVTKTFKSVSVSNGMTTVAMKVWTPINNKFFETFSYLPPFSESEIAKQVDYIIAQGWTPCLEFADVNNAYISNESIVRFDNGACVNHFDNRYWTMYKLPLFGCTDPSQVLKEVANARKGFPDAYIRLCAFDNIRQTQSASLLVHRPPSAKEFRPVSERTV